MLATCIKKSVPVECQLRSENQVNLNSPNLPEQVKMNLCAGFLSNLKQRNHHKEPEAGRSWQQHSCRAYILEEEVQLGVGVGVPGDLKEGVEDVVQQLLKVLNDALLLVHTVQPGQLHTTQYSSYSLCNVVLM